jgi:hypothetical protein
MIVGQAADINRQDLDGFVVEKFDPPEVNVGQAEYFNVPKTADVTVSDDVQELMD